MPPRLIRFIAFLFLLIVPAQSFAASDIDIWWPAHGSEIGNTQIFKAMVVDMNVDAYQMFWQVDDKGWNPMNTSMEDFPHKEGFADIVSWSWNASGAYLVTFMAEQTGALIATRSVTVCVGVTACVSSATGSTVGTGSGSTSSSSSSLDSSTGSTVGTGSGSTSSTATSSTSSSFSSSSANEDTENETPNATANGQNSGSESVGGVSVNDAQGSGSRRGHGTNILRGVTAFLTDLFSLNTSIPPGGFGGMDTTPFSDDEMKFLCSMKRAAPADPESGFTDWFTNFLADKLGRDAADIRAVMENMTDCMPERDFMPEVEQAAAPIQIFTDSEGYPVSSNPVWNACIRGYVTMDQIRSNTDRIDDRYFDRPMTCRDYHKGDVNVWRHPDYDELEIIWDPALKTVNVPDGYVVIPQSGSVASE